MRELNRIKKKLFQSRSLERTGMNGIKLPTDSLLLLERWLKVCSSFVEFVDPFIPFPVLFYDLSF